ncbi:MAG TPA: hypothetical protein VGV64_00265 [Thermoplasmata archaeon]|nr:hypothetical protein [Thermoplasmata archaeon]
MRLHRGGRWRAWLGGRFGGDAALGDRIWRRCLHLLGGFVLVYYLVPPGFFAGIPKPLVLLAALAAVLALEVLRHLAGLELPTLRPYEVGRVASFAFFATGLVLAVLLFPEPVAAAVALGTAIVDPLIGELRLRRTRSPADPLLPLAVYSALAFVAFRGLGGWSIISAGLLAAVAAVLGLLAERPRWRFYDDDLFMTIVPGGVLAILLALAPSLPSLGT